MLARDFANCRRVIAVVLCALIVTGCAIRPLPDDFAHVSTYTIVRQIRCETRQAVIESILTFLTHEKNHHVIHLANGHTFQKVDDNSYSIGMTAKEAYEADPTTIGGLKFTSLTGFARYVVDMMLRTGVAYNFDLTGTEMNNINSEVNLLRPLPVMTLPSLNAKVNFDRSRQNQRYFTITDTFSGLVTTVPDSYCTKSIVEANIVYPITGNVGMRRMIHDFVQLTLFGNLSADGQKDITGVDPKGPPTMVDQLDFETAIGGSVTPKVTFSPVGGTFQVADVNFGAAASRKDVHKLTVGLYLDKSGIIDEVIDARSVLFGGVAARRGGKGPLFAGLITASGGPAEKGAAIAVQQFLELKIFKPTFVFQQ